MYPETHKVLERASGHTESLKVTPKYTWRATGGTELNREGSEEHQRVHRVVQGLPESTWSAWGGLHSKLKGQADGPGGTSTQIRAAGDNEKQTEASGTGGAAHGGANDRGDH